MRLLHTSNLTMHEFFGNRIPEYAILSHRWDNEEVTFQDFRDGRGLGMAGWSKLIGCCAQAVLDGWEYVWIDSCCIDKSSSAELSEAINSMFRWYENSQVCYAYLSDVRTFPAGQDSVGLLVFQDGVFLPEFRASKWFTRGWTLQELLATYYVDFFDQNWRWIGSKASLEEQLKKITNITDFANYKNACVAQKMSWASSRETTRVEDQAYSLLGLFDVYMPPLYGEGENAFKRLQMEIIGKTDDDSIFAFQGSSGLRRMLATCPKDFAGSSSIVRNVWDPDRPAHTMSSKGLCLHFQLLLCGNINVSNFAPLNCTQRKNDGTIDIFSVVGFRVHKQIGNNTWHRYGVLEMTGIDPVTLANQQRTMLYAERDELTKSVALKEQKKIIISIKSLSDAGFVPKTYKVGGLEVEDGCDNWNWYQVPRVLHFEYERYDSFDTEQKQASVIFETHDYHHFELVLGMSKRRLWVDIVGIDDLWSEGVRKPMVVRCERVSRLFLTGALHAKVKGLPSSCFFIDITFDPERKLRWPARSL